MNALELHQVCKSYPGFSLDHVDLTLPSGTILGLIGENGAGKTTLIKTILDMVHRDSGTVTLLGRDNQDHLELTKQDIGVVLDEVGIPQAFTPLMLDKVLSRTFTRWDHDVYMAYLKRFSIPWDQNFKTLSRGMKMKLGLAAALSHQPKLLLLDEATAGLDPVIRDEILDLFLEFTREESHSILISSHIVSDLEKICDYIAFLHQGRIILCEEKDRLAEQYGLIQGTREELAALAPDVIQGCKTSPYGAEALVLRKELPADWPVQPVDLETLFIYRVKGESV